MENKKILKFPEGFLWGASTSAYQVEGNNHNDWTEWEKENAEKLAKEAKNKWLKWQQEKFPEMFDPQNYISGRVCDHYNRFAEDFDIAKSLGHNAHRFSIEWSRIEPEEGKFDEEAIEHYRQIILALRERGMEPFVTLWHFTNPVWFAEKGGWENKNNIDYYVRYAEKMIRSFLEVKYWTTFNEPNIYAGYSYIKGSQPPGVKNIFRAFRVVRNMLRAHKKAYGIIHQHSDLATVGLVNSVIYFVGIFKFFANYFWNFYPFNKVRKFNDFIGVNYYSRKRAGFALNTARYIGWHTTRYKGSKNITDLGWEIFPEGIYYATKKFAKYNLPIFITENGLANADDSRRGEFVKDHLGWLCLAIKEGVDVRGYFYWSFLEIFEMVDMRGYWPKFGLVEVDSQTMERRIRNSAWEYKKIIDGEVEFTP